jgi:hypothetical protein
VRDESDHYDARCHRSQPRRQPPPAWLSQSRGCYPQNSEVLAGRSRYRIALSMTTQTPCSRGERLSKANVHRCRRSHFSARALITNPGSVFGPSSRICIARASSLASSRTGRVVQVLEKRAEKEQRHIRLGGLRQPRWIVHAGPLKIMVRRGKHCERVHTVRV